MRKCRQCSEYLDPGMFRTGSRGKPKATCRACENTSNLKRYHGNPSTRTAHRNASRRYILKQYGLDEGDFNNLRTAASFRCEICSTHEDDTRFGTLSVDHDHATGMVRGLLCLTCNVAIGHLREDIAILNKAIAYLERHKPCSEGSFTTSKLTDS